MALQRHGNAPRGTATAWRSDVVHRLAMAMHAQLWDALACCENLILF
jgi:hypothetical protein